MRFIIKEPIYIPYFDHDKSLSKTIKRSAKRRRMNPFFFALRKFCNILFARWSYFCPLNSWRIRFNRWRGVNIGENVYIGMHCMIDNAYPEYVYIEDNVSIANEVTIIAHSNPYAHFSNIVESTVQPTILKNGAWIGIRSIVLPGVEIGEKSIVSAGSVVEKSIPSYSLVKGNPAKKVLDFEGLLNN